MRNHIRVLEVISTPFDSVTESLLLSLQINGSILCVGEIYRVPNTPISDFEITIGQIFPKLKKFKNIVIGSDHNLDLIKSSLHHPTELFLEWLADNSLIPVITKPTRVAYDTSTLIDNIFVKGHNMFQLESFVMIEDLSDHYPCVVRIESSKREDELYVINSRNLSNHVFDRLNCKLLFHDWNVMSSSNMGPLECMNTWFKLSLIIWLSWHLLKKL